MADLFLQGSDLHCFCLAPGFTRLKGYFSIERMGEKEEPLVPVPEFERRCNAFVEEVYTAVVPKYPNLIIIPTNVTQAGLEMPSLTSELSEKVQQKFGGEELEEYEQVSKKNLEEAREISREADIESATANRAVVVIVPESDGLEEETFRAAEEVKEIAAKYEVKADQNEVIPKGYLSPSVFLDILFES